MGGFCDCRARPGGLLSAILSGLQSLTTRTKHLFCAGRINYLVARTPVPA